MKDRNRKIQELVQHGYEFAPAIRQMMDAAGVAPADIQGAADLAKIPVLSKDALVAMHQANPPFGGLLTIDPADLPRIYISPGPIYDPQPPLEDPQSQLAPFKYLGIGRGDRVLNTFMYHLSPAGILLDEAIRACGATVIPTGPGNTELQIMMMMALQATGFVGTPSYLMTILDKAAALGIGEDALPITKALFSAEPYTPSQAERFEGEFGIKTSSAYGTADLGFIGYTRAEAPGFRVMSNVFLQICDPQTGAALPDGATGEIVATSFNRAYPLIRFGTGDLGAVTTSCDSQELLGIFGRSGDAVKVRGMFLHPKQLQAALTHFPEIHNIQAVITRQSNRDMLTLKVELRTGAEADGIANKLQALAQAALRLRIDAVEIVAAGALDSHAGHIIDRREWD